jgi:hypothetical protein
LACIALLMKWISGDAVIEIMIPTQVK